MGNQVEVPSQEIGWHDAEGWTEEMRDWILAWIEVVTQNKPTVTQDANEVTVSNSFSNGRVK